ncbi:hypothetical protein J3A64_004170 [Pseudarthrobacter sp. PvP004]|nr:hypothetical protein [Pseudarthrobacter sp. PvP004]MBP2268067.1 hypothetical protein [Pseudarthrobacter sp. PvP004]MBP2268071.1 hypothetical protein [Pseudarthrobacter sp. PvP004]MBP2268702.1 hypothetical protein [Pseudarthrobacter sp. PvP004]MBP2268706.1 hypothetical protein [Pseudarthrobacter sp. PvP004]
MTTHKPDSHPIMHHLFERTMTTRARFIHKKLL